ncbi:(S)-mandelate dehydrogenase [Burkholderiales bacterium]|nr:(S)-mandelate dehydrogenase [Burkholderiales bacterium]
MRKLYSGTDFRAALTIEELREVARRRVPAFAFEYVEGGAEDERTLRWNRDAFAHWRFLPRTLVDTQARHQRISLFGREQGAPLVIAPTGLNGMLHHRADAALARAAAAAGIPFTLSTVSNLRLEALPRESEGRLWMQLYMVNRRDIAEAIIDRAAAAGYEALVFTSDANVFGHREWDKRNYRRPGKLSLRNLLDVALHPRWIGDVMLPHGVPRFENLIDFLPPEAQSAAGGVQIVPKLFTATITWDDLRWMRERWKGRLMIKGVLSVDDARRARDAGADGIVLSNHGGRQLESCVSALDMLPEVVAAVGSELAVLIDGGFRRGGDVVKALALGAAAVMIGRPVLYGVAAGGEAGAKHALDILFSEIDRVLGQLGVNSIAELEPGMLRQAK